MNSPAFPAVMAVVDFGKADTVAPANYKVVIKIPGQRQQIERIKLTAGSTWAIIALPTGGYMPMQLY